MTDDDLVVHPDAKKLGEWHSVNRHPHFPDIELEIIGERGEVRLEDPNNSDAWIQGEGLEVGVMG